MCGIAGIVNFSNEKVKDPDIRLMMHKMKHRGPDDEGVFIEKNIGLGFVRLSILDLSPAGHQPMFSHDERYVIIFNGEVYNYIELRAELKTHFNFRSGTDTEVILAAYQHWGSACLDKFNGMFAFVIYNRLTGEIFGARDRFGIKPLYYLNTESEFIFASEIKSILPFVENRQANNNIIYDYLLYNRTDHEENTFFEGIKKIQHGHSFTIGAHQFKIQRWYDIKERIPSSVMSVSKYRELFKDSLKLRLRSDVPVGVCLSGGLDSSTIVGSLLHDFKLSNINTFSAVYGKNEPSDESRYINEFNSLLKNMYFITPSADSFYNDYDSYIDAHNEPVPDTGPYAQYKVMELASKYVKVTLDGQGADEVLAGYDCFYGSYYVELFKKLKWLRFFAENLYFLHTYKSLKAFKYFLYYLFPEWLQTRVSSHLFASVNKNFISQYSSGNNINTLLYKPDSLLSSLIQHVEYKLEHLLRWEDLNAMHFSIESRVPFLDYRLVENTLALPSNMIIKDGVTKHILRLAMKDILPVAIYNRKDKKGFSNPREKWFRTTQFKELIMGLLHSKSFSERGYFNSKMAIERYQLHLSGKADLSKEIWKYIHLELWFRKFIDN
jgi:asparagine synthase (glutamine-hydrolysing)